MPDPFAELNLCEEGVRRHPVNSETVVFPGVWGIDAFGSKIAPMIAELAVDVKSIGLRDEGIAVTFDTPSQASLARLFYKGDTLTGA